MKRPVFRGLTSTTCEMIVPAGSTSSILHQQTAIGWYAPHLVERVAAALRSAGATHSCVQREPPSVSRGFRWRLASALGMLYRPSGIQVYSRHKPAQITVNGARS